jgi:hypothetical protein
MTFVEAAIEVLRREGKPLPVKRLAELAVKHNLLSVVGRDPEGTMEARLADAVEGHRDLLTVRPGVYGLKVYPGSRASEAPPAAAAETAGSSSGEGGEGTGKRRRRGRRGRGKGEAAKSEAAKAAPAEAAAEPATEEEAPAAEEAKPEAAKEAKAEGEGGKRRRRSRRGGRGRRRGGAKETATQEDAAEAPAEPEAAAEEPPEPEAAAEEPPELEEPPVAAEPPPEAPPAAPELIDDLAEGEGELLEEDEVDLPSGPLLAPTHGAEELTRTDEERVVRAEIHGRREERGRHRRERGRRRDGREHGHAQPHGHGQAQQPSHAQQAPHGQQPPTSAPAQPQATPSGRRTVLDVVLELLRQSDGRPMHARHLTELAVKKQLLDGHPNELLRQVRAALVREVREREAEGLRARVRSLGGGHFALVDKKLDPELAQAERELAASAARQRESTRLALRRRLGRMAPAAFEALGRALLDKLGVTGVELIRRGEGVAYFGGARQLGAGTLKTLVALRPGEAEINRRAVGELRAGLAARGYDEGLLLAGGRLGADGAAELKNGSGVVLHDGSSLATLLVKHGLGVRRLYLPVDYLDVEFLSELTEG